MWLPKECKQQAHQSRPSLMHRQAIEPTNRYLVAQRWAMMMGCRLVGSVH